VDSDQPTVSAPEFVTVVLPCLNEENSVGLVVEEALSTLKAAGIPGEVLVVDNGSIDRSAEIAASAGARVIREDRLGYGRATRTGIAAASGTIVVMADADWTYDMTKLPQLIAPIVQGIADLAMGSRLHEATRETMPILHRYVGTPALTAFIRTAGGYGALTDSQSGFRCFRKETITRLKLRANGMELTSEMLLKSSRSGLRLVEVPTGYRKRIGHSKLKTLHDGLRNLRILIWLAPEAFFLAPGAALFLLGATFTGLAFVPTRGIEIGSLRWQPVFFATIALVLGLQTLLVGLVFVWHRTTRTGRRAAPQLRFVSAPSFPLWCLVVGAVLLLSGFGLDAWLVGKWIAGQSGVGYLPVASLAQSLLLLGGSLTSFGLIVMWLRWDRRQNQIED
jgi:hypothetical protein